MGELDVKIVSRKRVRNICYICIEILSGDRDKDCVDNLSYGW